MKGNGDFSIGSPVWPGTSKLIEEMGELHQVLGKLLGTAGEPHHWDGSNLRERLVEELADLQAAIVFFRQNNMTSDEQSAIAQRAWEKVNLFEEWHAKKTKP